MSSFFYPVVFTPPMVTVSGLPSAASSTGAIYEISDALAPTLGIAVVGGGAVGVYVKSNGTSWLVR